MPNINVITILIIGIFLMPLLTGILCPIASNSINCHVKRIFLVTWKLAKSILMVIVFSLLLNFYSNYISDPSTDEYINNSTAYQIINNNVLRPILNTDIAKRIPGSINNSFRKASEAFTPTNTKNLAPTCTEDFTQANNDDVKTFNYWKQPVIKYFNGVTLDEAVKSSSEIDYVAKQIVGTESNDKKKAYLLYKWISKNIKYDKGKAKIISKTPSHVNSGSIVTYSEKMGVCFDYSCLYVSMCRAVGLKVRFITGMGHNRVKWSNHAWNQVYYANERRWINVDTTFGHSGYNYFDNPDFSADHKYEVIQYEW